MTPVTIQNRTMVPVRKTLESLGASVDWNEASGTIICTKDGTFIILNIDSREAAVNGFWITLEVPATIMDGIDVNVFELFTVNQDNI